LINDDSEAKFVRDVDGTIIKEIQENPSNGYLIKFHAPWCGHCRHFEPVYEEIAQEIQLLANDVDEFRNIHIVRIDATVHSDVANYYDIRGFPTLKFIRQSDVITYENDRSKSAIFEFLRRVNGPAIRWISSSETFHQLRRENPIFFLLVSTTNDSLATEYEDIARRYRSEVYFYATNISIDAIGHSLTDDSQVFSIQIDDIYRYESNSYHKTLDDFVVKERISTFPQISSSNIRDVISTKKILIIYAFDDKTGDVSSLEKKNAWKEQIYRYALEHRSNYRENFQFGFSHDFYLLNHIAVWTLDEPILFLYDSIQHKYGIYPLSLADSNKPSFDQIFQYLLTHSSEIIQYTGDNWSKRLFRPFWEMYRTIVALFIESPKMTMLIIGLPASLLSIVCYCLCCLPVETSMDENKPLEESDSEEEEEEALPSSVDNASKKDD